MQLHNLFPVPLGIFKLDRLFTQDEISFFDSVELRNNEGNLTSIKRNLLEEDQLKDLSKWIYECIKRYFESIHIPSQDTKLRITQSWTNVTSKGQYHHKHYHPNSFVSGVLYINGSEEEDKIIFFRDKKRVLKTPSNSFNEFNSDTWWMPSGTGTLYLFPSDLEHCVETIDSDRKRVSLAFNTFPVGKWGCDSSLTGLEL